MIFMNLFYLFTEFMISAVRETVSPETPRTSWHDTTPETLEHGGMTKAPGIAIFFILALHSIFVQNQVRIFPATLLQISGSLRSR